MGRIILIYNKFCPSFWYITKSYKPINHVINFAYTKIANRKFISKNYDDDKMQIRWKKTGLQSLRYIILYETENVIKLTKMYDLITRNFRNKFRYIENTDFLKNIHTTYKIYNDDGAYILHTETRTIQQLVYGLITKDNEIKYVFLKTYCKNNNLSPKDIISSNINAPAHSFRRNSKHVLFKTCLK